MFANGYNAVSFFFVLSGFVLAYVYAADGNGDLVVESRAFWKNRFARIYPAYALALLVSLPAHAYSAFVAHITPVTPFIGSLLLVPFLLQAWLPPLALAWNTPAWSLSVEAFFYAGFPSLLRRSARVKPMKWLALSLGAVVGMTVLREWLGAAPCLGLADGNRQNLVLYFPPFFLPHFALGVALSRWLTTGKGSSSLWATGLFVSAGAVVLLLFAGRSRVPGWLLTDAMLVPLYGAIVWGGAQAAGSVARLFSARALVQLGEASYALYILHMPLAF